jgi:uncharacterized protein (DUF885 family)/ABC-type dipeptide/oligopeptide/nickel transport system permease component
MRTLLLRRLVFALVALLCILYLASLGLHMARGLDFGVALQRAGRSSIEYVWGLLQGDLGQSTSRSREPIPAGPVIARTTSKSLALLAVSLTIAAVLGIFLGGLAARRRRSPWALPTMLLSLLGISMPSFFLAMLLQIAAIGFYQRTGLRLVSVGGFKWSSLWLPSLVLAARPLAQITRVTFFSISEALEEDYVRTALSKGISRGALFRRHVYRNVAIPVFTTLVTSLRFSLISLPVVEYFFSWPGSGEALLRGIRRQDDALVYGLLLCLGLLFIVMNALLEGLYRLIDPRLRGAGPRQKRQISQLRPDLWSALGELAHSFLDSAPVYWLRRMLLRQPRREPSAFSQVLHRRALERGGEDLGTMHRRERRQAWFRGVLLNPPLLVGLLFLIPLLAVILFGSALAPHNPYNTTSFVFIEGKIQTPPFPPSGDFPWGSDALGRDMLSLILIGAQQTLVIAAIVMLARIAIGGFLGLLAGWFEGTWLDRLIGNLIEIIAAFPALLCAMVLILALGIRRGLSSFVVALCFVGWGEVAQFVRAQVVSLKPRPFVEAAVVTGGRWPDILSRHILPNLLSPLVGLAALEMGAVLMLLGELGFVGIFIGGGAFAQLVVFGPPYYYSDVPEWAALLANIRGYARSYPWMAWSPVLAFVATILAFNLTGEGILRLIERVGASFTRLLNRYTALAAMAFVALIFLVRMQTGPMALNRPLAEAFDGERALGHVQVLASPEMAGRRLGTEEVDEAAQYIAAQFEAAGLQPAGQLHTYFQEVKRDYVALTRRPSLQILTEKGSVQQDLTWRQDFNVAFHLPYRVDGDKRRAEVVFAGVGPLARIGSADLYPFFRDLPLQGKVVLVPNLETYDALRRQCPMAGALIISDDPAALRSLTLGTPHEIIYSTHGEGGWFGLHPRHPVLLVTRAVAEELVSESGFSLEDFEKQVAQLAAEEALLQPLGKRVSLEVPVRIHQTKGQNVIAFLPGGRGTGGAGWEFHDYEFQMNDEIVILMAAYDGLGVGPDGTLFPGAQDNAAGVATLIELAHSWREADYRPKRTFLFVAYAGQGGDRAHSYRQHPEPDEFLQAASGFSMFKIWAVLEMRGLGDPQGRRLVVDTSSAYLGNLLEQASRRIGVNVHRIESILDLEAVQEDREAASWRDGSMAGVGTGERFTGAEVRWEGGEEIWGTEADGPQHLSAESLEQAGQVISLALMVLGRGETTPPPTAEPTAAPPPPSPSPEPTPGAGEEPAASPTATATTMPVSTPTPVPVADVIASLQGLHIDDFFEESFKQLLLRDPEKMTELGVAEQYGLRNDRLNDLSDAYIRETQQLESAILDLLLSYDRSTLTPEQQISYDVYEWYLGDLVRGHQYMYCDYPVHDFYEGYHDHLLRVFVEIHPIRNVQDAEDYITRLSLVDHQVSQVLEGLWLREQVGVIPPKFIIRRTINVLQAYLQMRGADPNSVSAHSLSLYRIFNEKLSQVEDLGAKEKTALLQSAREEIRNSFIPAYLELLDYLEYLAGIATEDAGVWKFPDCEGYYSYALSHETSTDLTAEEIHNLGLAEVERIRAEMRAAFDQLGYPQGADLGELMDRAIQEGGVYDTVTQEQKELVVAVYEGLLEEVGRRMEAVFDIGPQADVIVVGDPDMGGFYTPASVDGSRPGAFHAYVGGAHLLKYSMGTVAFHEAIPGHHYQIALSQELDLPTFRRYLQYNGYIEGWALYAEQLAWELGMYDDDPYGNLGRLEFELLRAVRLVADTGIHAKRWTREEATAYMNEAMGGQRGSHEVYRYIVWPGQATGYKVGMVRILELRQRAMDELGDQFDIKEFHRVILENGSLPLEILERVVQEYIDTKQASLLR